MKISVQDVCLIISLPLGLLNNVLIHVYMGIIIFQPILKNEIAKVIEN